MNKRQLASLVEMGKDLHILYVEDNDHTRKEISEQLSIFFPHITVACDGEEGLEKFKNSDQKFDLIISDIKMPKMDGLEMIQQIREVDSSVKVLMFSAYDTAEYMRKSLNLSVDGYLLKPLDHQQFLTEIARVSGYIKLEKENASYQAGLEQMVEQQVKTIQEAYRRLEETHYHDTLTQLPNQFALQRDFFETEGSLLLLDIKNFKAINQIYGSGIGNELLQSVAASLKKLTEEKGYLLYKMQLDIYAIVSTEDEKTFVQWVESCVGQLENELYLFADGAIEIGMEMSCGISRFGSLEQIIKEANVALQYAKDRRIYHAVYQERYQQLSRQHFDIEMFKKIKTAISSDDIIPSYQAIVDQNGDLVAYEALVCMRDGDDLIEASQFMQTARYSKYYHDISRAVIRKSFEKFRESSLGLAINLSVADITDEATAALLLHSIRHYPNPEQIILEIVELESAEDITDILSFVTTVRMYGVKIAIERFGGGHSGFSSIMRIRPDIVKIDNTLMRYIDKDKQASDVVENIVQVIHALGMKCVGGFIDSDAIYQQAQSFGIDYYQGYHIHKPSLDLV